MAYTTKNERLSDLYSYIESGATVLPDFQRGFVWDTSRQQKLIASFLIKVPIGSTLFLTGNNQTFLARELCKETAITPQLNCEYVLDGQQRLSTLKNAFYDLYAGQVWSQAGYGGIFDKLRHRWFLNIQNSFFGFENLQFNSNLLETTELDSFSDFIEFRAIKKTTDWYHPGYSPVDENGNILQGAHRISNIVEKACSEHLVPLYELFLGNLGIHKKVLTCLAKKRTQYLKNDIVNGICTVEDILDITSDEYSQLNDIDKTVIWTTLESNWVNAITNYFTNVLNETVPIILLPLNEASRAASIFEEINKGGLALSTYDLIVAKAARVFVGQTLTQRIDNSFNNAFNINPVTALVQNWAAVSMRNKKKDDLKKFHEIFLGVLSIVIESQGNNKQISKDLISKKNVLNLDPNDISRHLDTVLKGMTRAYAFLHFKCGVINEKNIRYVYMIIPIAYALSYDSIWNDPQKINRLEGWYWWAFFSGEFERHQDQALEVNLNNLIELLINNNLPECWNVNGQLVYDKNVAVMNKHGYSDMITLKTNSSKAMEDALVQYVLSTNPNDFQATTVQLNCNSIAQTPLDVEIHHIIPLANATTIGQSTKTIRSDKGHILSSPLNLSYISKHANGPQYIGSMNVAQYIPLLGVNNTVSHFLNTTPNFYDKRVNESDEEYYNRCIDDRFNSIKTAVLNEIRTLS